MIPFQGSQGGIFHIIAGLPLPGLPLILGEADRDEPRWTIFSIYAKPQSTYEAHFEAWKHCIVASGVVFLGSQVGQNGVRGNRFRRVLMISLAELDNFAARLSVSVAMTINQ